MTETAYGDRRPDPIVLSEEAEAQWADQQTRARRYIATHVHDADDARLLLDVLGLADLDEDDLGEDTQ